MSEGTVDQRPPQDSDKYEQAVLEEYPSVRSLHTAATIGTRNSVFLAGFVFAALILLFQNMLGLASEQMAPPAITVPFFAALVFLILTVAYLIFATECFLRLPQAATGGEIRFWGRWGSRLYGWGTAALVASLAILLALFTSDLMGPFGTLPYLVLAIFTIGWVAYFPTRDKFRNSRESASTEGSPWWSRWWSRLMMWAHLLAALFIVVLVQSV